MRSLFFACATLGLALIAGCAEALPEKINLKPEGEQVEIINERPNQDLYVPMGEITAAAMGDSKETALVQAKNDLRNQAAARGASLVSVDNVEAKLEWQGRKTAVKATGTAYKPKD
jgi:ADP-ribose pyrophosphatase YjhB (NUDIX family)